MSQLEMSTISFLLFIIECFRHTEHFRPSCDIGRQASAQYVRFLWAEQFGKFWSDLSSLRCPLL